MRDTGGMAGDVAALRALLDRTYGAQRSRSWWWPFRLAS
jgi:hypothetical protein